VRRALPRHVAAAGCPCIASRATVEGSHGVTTSAAPVLDVRDISLRRGAREILRHVSFTANHGEIVAIMGASGSGKTTMLRVIAGLERHDSGRIAIEGGRAGMVFQFHC